jgi:hypothetical protein
VIQFNQLPGFLTQAKLRTIGFGLLGLLLPLAWQQSSATAASLSVGLTALSGTTGGTPAGTQVFRADLSNLGFNLASITIQDTSGGVGGSPGQFSGFDLDAIKLSRSRVTAANSVNGLTGLSGFNFTPTGTSFTPGTQRSPVASKLFGTNSTGNAINNSVATLGNFDGNATTGASADGFVSIGDGGSIVFNLASLVNTNGPLYLYIGEVGGNGESLSANIVVSDTQGIPTPALLPGLIALGTAAWRKQRQLN